MCQRAYQGLLVSLPESTVAVRDCCRCLLGPAQHSFGEYLRVFYFKSQPFKSVGGLLLATAVLQHRASRHDARYKCNAVENMIGVLSSALSMAAAFRPSPREYSLGAVQKTKAVKNVARNSLTCQVELKCEKRKVTRK